MAPSKTVDIRTSVGRQKLLGCTEWEMVLLEVTFKHFVKARFNSNSRCQKIWEAIEISHPSVRTTLYRNQRVEGNFFENLEQMKTHLYSTALQEVEAENSKGGDITAQKLEAKRRWNVERDQDDDEPTPVKIKKMKIEGEAVTKTRASPLSESIPGRNSKRSAPSSATQSSQSLEELLKAQVQKSTRETTEAVEAHVREAVEKRVSAREKELRDGIVAMDEAKARLTKAEALLAEVKAEHQKKVAAEAEDLKKRETAVHQRENILLSWESRRRKYVNDQLTRALGELKRIKN
ncbi:unnamed protein product [Zymoseptoria tritici ST99CH_3D7]|uniref:Uncharacterized protein n=1 Tax=Zymoseptoria tritici (strain ST99CH_3D7) TaxID=1276538 RepID=A0A1X7RTH0_ZYMT9|nr:unnamed protein product [Zymoseptoria tritici ST99CH_3D7]